MNRRPDYCPRPARHQTACQAARRNCGKSTKQSQLSRAGRVCVLVIPFLLFFLSTAQADTIRWRGTDSWGDGDWDTVTSNWRDAGNSPTTYTTGDDVQFVPGVGITSFRGVVMTAPMNPSTVTVELPNAFGSASFTGNSINTSGAFTIQNGGQVRLSGTTLSFSNLVITGTNSYLQGTANPFSSGTDPIFIDQGGRLHLDTTTTITNPITIGSGGGSIAPNNAALTYTGAITLGGDLVMGTTSSNSRARIDGSVNLTSDSTITSQISNASWSFSEINGGVNGEFKLTMNSQGTSSSFKQRLQTGAVNVGDFEKIGPGVTTISVGSILGDVSELEALFSDQTFSIQDGQVELTALSYANKLILGSTEYTTVGTYGSVSGGTADNLIDDATWNTYFLGSNGMIEVVAAATPVAPVPEPSGLLLLGLGASALVFRTRRRR